MRLSCRSLSIREVRTHSSLETRAPWLIKCALKLRFLHFVHDRRWCPEALRRTRVTFALWRTALYWILTLLRLCQMLVVMSFNATLLLLTVRLRTFPTHPLAHNGETGHYVGHRTILYRAQ